MAEFIVMVNAIDVAKRALVTLLRATTALYGVSLTVSRDACDASLRSAYRKISVKTHPDRGGNVEHQKQVNAAYEACQKAVKDRKGHGGKRGSKRGESSADGVPTLIREGKGKASGYRFQSAAVLLTYQKFTTKVVWERFVEFVRGSLVKWSVKFWGATLSFLQTRKAQNAAKRQWISLKSVCKIVVRKKGAASGM